MHVFDTDRLSLRRFHTGDAAFILAILNDPDWLTNIGDRGVYTEDQSRDWIRTRVIPSYQRANMGMWAVQVKGTGELAGMCGLVKRETLPDNDLGYAFMPAYRGRGYALEAARACMDHGQRVVGLRRILATTVPGNVASQRVLEAVGMRLFERRMFDGETEPTCIYEWKAAGA